MAKKKAPSPPPPPFGERLQKVLALSGLGSRRQCEELITAGRVEINRRTITELGARVDIDQQEVRVDGQVIKLPKKKYFLLHKPVGVISTSSDPWARTRVIDLVDDSSRLFTVGRLDKASSGLILLTNDGDLAQHLTHPKYGIEKVYRATVVGKPSQDAMRQLRQGLYLAEGKTHVERVTLLKAHPTKSLLEIVLKEGRNREIRRILARVGHKVVQLKRIAIGPLRLGEIPLGAFRELTRTEIQALQRSAEQASQDSAPRKRRAKTFSKPGAKASGPRRKESRPAAGRTTSARTTGRSERSRPPAGPPLRPRRATTIIGDEGEHEGPPTPPDDRSLREEGYEGSRRPRRDTRSQESVRPKKPAGRSREGRPSGSTGGRPATGQRSGTGRSAAPKKKGRRPIVQRKKRTP